MQTPITLLPDSQALTSRLAAAFSVKGVPELTVLERKRPRYMSTFPNEIVTCQLPGGRQRRLFCKYEAGPGHNAYGHRGGLAYARIPGSMHAAQRHSRAAQRHLSACGHGFGRALAGAIPRHSTSSACQR